MRKINPLLKCTLFLATTAIANLLTSCTAYHQNINPTNLNQLQNLHYEANHSMLSTVETSELRSKSLQDTALTLGAQGGLAKGSQEINRYLEKDEKHLESIFNFNAMVLSHGVMPPVLTQGDNSLNLDDPNTIRVADKTYKIVKQAHFATTPPNWREYLWLPYTAPEMPNKMLLPKTAEERKIWSKYIKLGWESGLQQSQHIFNQNLARLKRDYNGMILYRKLLQEKMINPPFVARTNLGITGGGDVMRVNDQVLRITELPQLKADGNEWQAIVVPH